ncbi:uncharacterized protein LOC124892660 [Capsicum annuum]|uniref:uncharacterized protein LOC124892660 n=1 Tax=Capsicum annuum TaxID=4072 RepID=UPI001FB1453F|nr:uncharacterized protein LOC124892660 [Capsicum annuum]
MEKSRYLPNSVLLSMPSTLEQFKALWLDLLMEKKALNLALLIFWPEAALKLEMVERIALQLALSSLANNVRLSAKNRALLQQMGNLLVLHEDRSTNAVADRLAKEGNKLAQDSFCEEWVVPPMFIRKELELDKEGTTLVGQYMSLSMDICICSARKELSPARLVLTICTND